MLAIIDRLQKENEALKRENDRLREGDMEGSRLRRVRLLLYLPTYSLIWRLTGVSSQRVGELEANAQSSSIAGELEQLRQKLAEAEQERARLAECVLFYLLGCLFIAWADNPPQPPRRASWRRNCKVNLRHRRKPTRCSRPS